MEAEINDLTAAIDRAERARERDAMLAAPTSEALTGKPDNGKMSTKTGRASAEYHRDMMNAIRTGFRQVSNLLQESVDADGGYLVPEELDKRLITVLDEECVMRSLATKVRTSGDRKINIAANRPSAARCSTCVPAARRSGLLRRRRPLSHLRTRFSKPCDPVARYATTRRDSCPAVSAAPEPTTPPT